VYRRYLGKGRKPGLQDAFLGRADISIAGPMWLGPLHNEIFLRTMAHVAEMKGWTGHAFQSGANVKLTGHNPARPLDELLQVLVAESYDILPPGYTLLQDVKKICGLSRLPRRDVLVEALRAKGHAACATHMEVRVCFKTCGVQLVAKASSNDAVPTILIGHCIPRRLIITFMIRTFKF
jgi:tRNA G26 N,N-dimethylase Trm1